MDPIIREATYKDKEAVLQLLNNVFFEQQRINRARGNEYWDWKFQDNPFGKAILTVAEHDGRIVAVSNLWPWEFEIRGSIIKALQPCDSAVDKDFRGRGLFKIMRIHGVEIAKERDYSLLFNYPNEMSIKAYMSLGWHFVGKIGWWVKILKPLMVIKNSFSEDKAKPLEISDAYKLNTDLLDEIVVNSKKYDEFLKIHRIQGFHKWRYCNHPNRSYGMILYENKIKMRKSAVIFTINQKGKNREMIIVDILGQENDTIQLLKLVVKEARKLNVTMIALMKNPKYQMSELWKMGFVPKKLKNMVTLPLNVSLEGVANNFSSWSLVAAMHDSI